MRKVDRRIAAHHGLVAGAAIALGLALLSSHASEAASLQGGATGTGPRITGAGGSQVPRVHFTAEDGRCLRVVSAGVRTRNALPAPPTTGGVITLPPGPIPGSIVWAGLYWVILHDTPPFPNAVTLNGVPVLPVPLGTTPSPCWPEGLASAFFANVTGIATPGANVVAGLDDSGVLGTGPESEGASLVVIYESQNTGSCEILVIDGNDPTALGGLCGSSVSNFLPSACPPGTPANLYFIGADGQGPAFGYADNQIWNGLPLGDGDDFDGSDPAAPTAPPPGPDFGWDTDAAPAGWSVISAPPWMATVDAPALPGAPCDCVNWVATVLEVGVRPCQTVGVRPETWDRVKQLYR